MPKPLVSVVMITYNHEKFIKQSIDGILMQKCNFPIELIISNDNSPDQTDIIIQEYLKNHPKADLIRYFKHEKNLGMMPNFLFSLKQAKSKYTAICEGDDYWTDPLKLQKQVDFMEKNPEFSTIFHQVEIREDDILEKIFPKKEEVNSVSTIEDLSKYNYIPTLSVLFKNPFKYPDYMLNSLIGDYPLHLYNAENGKIKFIPEVMGVYRKGVGIWSSQESLKKSKNTIISLKLIQENYRNKKTVYKNLTKLKNSYTYYYFKVKNKNQGIIHFIKELQKDNSLGKIPFGNKFIFYIKYLLKK